MWGGGGGGGRQREKGEKFSALTDSLSDIVFIIFNLFFSYFGSFKH